MNGDDFNHQFTQAVQEPYGNWGGFIPDGDELYYFDMSSSDEQGEFPIMRYDLMNDLIDTYASTFTEFLERLIDERSGGH